MDAVPHHAARAVQHPPHVTRSTGNSTRRGAEDAAHHALCDCCGPLVEPAEVHQQKQREGDEGGSVLGENTRAWL
eukprot:98836-Chlamydomonas_euryale.AAC.1